jgi:hypothetical protein
MVTRSIELYAAKTYIEGCERNRQAMYRYILLEGEKEVEYFGRKVVLPCFGVEIVREDMEAGSIYHVEKDGIESITTYRYKAVQLLKRLYDNNASPIHLMDIAGPIADDWVSDFDELLNDTAAQ